MNYRCSCVFECVLHIGRKSTRQCSTEIHTGSIEVKNVSFRKGFFFIATNPCVHRKWKRSNAQWHRENFTRRNRVRRKQGLIREKSRKKTEPTRAERWSRAAQSRTLFCKRQDWKSRKFELENSMYLDVLSNNLRSHLWMSVQCREKH